MATLIITFLFGLIMAYFATQNTETISLHFLNYSFSGIPIYLVVVGALLIGLLLSWVISLMNGVSTGMTIHGQESQIGDYKKENAELTRTIHKLELENEKLRGKKELVDDKSL